MKRVLIFTSLLCATWITNAQTPEDSVKALINSLFEGMRNSDAVSVKRAFADSAILQSISGNGGGETIVKTEAISEFADFISKLAKGSADEQIIYDVIKITGPLAVVWAPYKFFFKGVFSHCGIDSFQLVKINNEWKIQYLIDTRQRTGCR